MKELPADCYPATKLGKLLRLPTAFILQHAPKAGKYQASPWANEVSYFHFGECRAWMAVQEVQIQLYDWKQEQKLCQFEQLEDVDVRWNEYKGDKDNYTILKVGRKLCRLQRVGHQKVKIIYGGRYVVKSLNTKGFEIKVGLRWEAAAFAFDYLVELKKGY